MKFAFFYFLFRDLFEELGAFLRESCDRKQENVRRRKRKDNLRLQIVRVLELIASEKTFGRMASSLSRSYTPSSSGHHLGDGGQSPLPSALVEFFESCKGWLEAEADRDGGCEVRLCFCRALFKLIESFDMDIKEGLLKRETRRHLFQLCIGWSGQYAQFWSKVFPTASTTTTITTTATSTVGSGNCGEAQKAALEYASLLAAASLLTCGPIFQSSLLFEESQFYLWMDFLLGSEDGRVCELGERTLIMILEYNPDVGAVLDWVVSRCFTGSPQVADTCFKAIAILFSAREYPCDRYVAIINSALLYSGSPNFQLQLLAFRLLQVLDRRFFSGLVPLQTHGYDMPAQDERPVTLDAVLLKCHYAKNQTFLAKQLSLLHPELTMPVFSEISWRMKSARSDVRQGLLRYLQPWLHNMELVEPAIPGPNIITILKSLNWDVSTENIKQSVSSTSSCSLCGRKYWEDGERLVRRGWGSTEATEMVLNNLMYLTAKVSYYP